MDRKIHPNGRFMIKSASIQGFRCLDDVALSDCAPVNVVVGRNAHGKTALLEAIFLGLGPSPEIAQRFKTLRGIDGNFQGSLDDIEEFVWRDLFPDLDWRRVIKIALNGTARHNRSLRVSYGAPSSTVSITQKPNAIEGQSGIVFAWRRKGEGLLKVRPYFMGSGYSFPGAEAAAVQAYFFVANRPPSHLDVNRAFTRLRSEGLDGPILDALKGEFDFLESLDILTMGGHPLLYAGVRGVQRRLPLGLVSSGVNKLAAIVLTIAANPGSVVLIDELENGIHYERFPSLCRLLRKMSQEHSVQLFVSTHSGELISAMADAFEDAPKHLSVIQMTRGESSVHAQQLRGGRLPSTLRSVEVR